MGQGSQFDAESIRPAAAAFDYKFVIGTTAPGQGRCVVLPQQSDDCAGTEGRTMRNLKRMAAGIVLSPLLAFAALPKTALAQDSELERQVDAATGTVARPASTG